MDEIRISVDLGSSSDHSTVFPGADERSPSRAQYFSWINNTNEGSTEAQTLSNLDFFKWLRDEYGMQLDIYAWDAGNFDRAAGEYGDFSSEDFKRQYPRGYGPIRDSAAEIGCRMGVWGGPDGFGDTPESARTRIENMVALCRDYHFELFKFDGVCGGLRPDKVPAFIEMMQRCREYSPGLILLNHRLDFGEGMPHATTFLWEGAESYIDVHMTNDTTATHHRAGALGRGLVPGLRRLSEDHGVCISSCLDYWEDDLVLQAFNRCLILAPEIYGNPWLLRDDEFPRLARIYNMHRQYRDILVDGIVLDEAQYGPHAVSRGDDSRRFITLRNLGWTPTTYRIRLDQSIGLVAGGEVEVRRLHPHERVLGRFDFGSEMTVQVDPFRSCLIVTAVGGVGDIGVVGCDYEVIQDKPDKPVSVKLLGMSGSKSTVSVTGDRHFKAAWLDGSRADAILSGDGLQVTFPGEPLSSASHRKLGELSACPVPSDAEALYEATCFSADNNALEVRSLHRSGETNIPSVQAARDAFFDQPMFRDRGLWDKYMFDGDPDTFFSVWREATDLRVRGGTLRVDLGRPQHVDRLVIHALRELTDNGDLLYPPVETECVAEVSSDLVNWSPVLFRPLDVPTEEQRTVPIAKITTNGAGLTWANGRVEVLEAEVEQSVRYLRMPNAPDRISEVEAYSNGKALDRSAWRGSNLFASYESAPAVAAWSGKLRLDEAAPGSYLCIALNGTHGVEMAYAALRINGRYVGAPDRSPSYPSMVWEYMVRASQRDYTYYIPVTSDMIGSDIEVVVLGMDGGAIEITPEVWVTCQSPLVSLELVLSYAE